MVMADFLLSATTMNLDGLRSSLLRKLTMYTLATARGKIARNRGQSKGGLRPFPLSHELTETKTPQPSFCSTSPAADFREGRPGNCLDLASHYSKSHFSQFTATNTSQKVIPFSVGEF